MEFWLRMRPLVVFSLAVLVIAPVAPAWAAAPASSRVVINTDESEDVPRGAPTDDYGFVAWCYGALDESLGVYETIKPDLKAIDALFGSPVQEDVPYAQDVVAERVALKRFQAAMTAAEKASPSIAPAGVAAVAKGRMIWARAKQMSSRLQADTWLYWGVPNRCESTARTLKERAIRPDQAAAIAAEALADLSPVDTSVAEQSQLTPPPEAELGARRPVPALALPPRHSAQSIDPNAPVASAGGSDSSGAP